MVFPPKVFRTESVTLDGRLAYIVFDSQFISCGDNASIPRGSRHKLRI